MLNGAIIIVLLVFGTTRGKDRTLYLAIGAVLIFLAVVLAGAELLKGAS